MFPTSSRKLSTVYYYLYENYLSRKVEPEPAGNLSIGTVRYVIGLGEYDEIRKTNFDCYR